MKINHHYEIQHEKVINFPFNFDNGHVSYPGYKITFGDTPLDLVALALQNNPADRQVVLNNSMGMFSDNSNPCLVYVQFQIVSDVLVLIANFRSQSEKYGRVTDDWLLRYIASRVNEVLKMKFIKIYVNVGNYHDDDI